MYVKQFSHKDQEAFAELSGDYNPLHIDKVAARRLMFGHPIVHGVHATLWALDRWLGNRSGPVRLLSLRARFQAGIPVDAPASCEIVKQETDGAILEVSVDGQRSTRVEAQFETSQSHTAHVADGIPPRLPPRALTESEAANLAGNLELCLDTLRCSQLFPHIAERLPHEQIAAILGTSRLVGMECPGLHSTYSELDLRLSSSNASGPLLNYRVQGCDERFHLLTLSLMGGSMEGHLKAFMRPKPQSQASYASIQRKVDGQQFSQQIALVVGGSRGLGEVTSKVLAAGGATVYLTYCQGQKDAENVADEIAEGGGLATSHRLDVLDTLPTLSTMPTSSQITHLYYFATPFVDAGRSTFSAESFYRYCAYYVVGFVNVVDAVVPRGLCGVLYPSTVTLDTNPLNLGEYAAAKSAGETVCAFLARRYRTLTIRSIRLPRVATDQTAGVHPAHSHEPLDVLLPELCEFARCKRH